MGEKNDQKKKSGERLDLAVKRCPECFVNLPLDAKRCFACNTRVGGVDKHGKARPAVNWVSYIICIISWAVFFIYIKWAFDL